MMTNNPSRRCFLKTIGLAAALPFVPRPLLAEPDGATLHRIMTCNILFDLPEQKGTPEDWSAGRRDVCLKAIKARRPDIFCLQEVGLGQRDDFATAFPEFTGFGYVDPYTDTNPRRFQSIKNMIFYSSARYEQISSGQYWLSETPLIAGSRLAGEGLPRHVTWVRLKDRASKKQFRILNTHWGLKQPTRAIEAKILSTEAGSPYHPDFRQLLCGDFNSVLRSIEHNTLADAGWKDTYETIHGPVKNEPSSPFLKHKIDYIYFHGKVTPAAAEIFREQQGGIYPSDHPFVSADVTL